MVSQYFNRWFGISRFVAYNSFALQGYDRKLFVKLRKITTADGREAASSLCHRTTRQSKYFAIW